MIRARFGLPLALLLAYLAAGMAPLGVTAMSGGERLACVALFVAAFVLLALTASRKPA